METSWYSNVEEGGSPDPDTEWIKLDLEGNIIDKKKEIDSVTVGMTGQPYFVYSISPEKSLTGIR